MKTPGHSWLPAVLSPLPCLASAGPSWPPADASLLGQILHSSPQSRIHNLLLCPFLAPLQLAHGEQLKICVGQHGMPSIPDEQHSEPLSSIYHQASLQSAVRRQSIQSNLATSAPR